MSLDPSSSQMNPIHIHYICPNSVLSRVFHLRLGLSRIVFLYSHQNCWQFSHVLEVRLHTFSILPRMSWCLGVGILNSRTLRGSTRNVKTILCTDLTFAMWPCRRSYGLPQQKYRKKMTWLDLNIIFTYRGACFFHPQGQ